MNSDFDRLAEDLRAYRELQHALAKIHRALSPGEKGELICRYLGGACGATNTSLFVRRMVNGRFHFRAGSGAGTSPYAGGFLAEEGTVLQPADAQILQALPADTASIHTSVGVQKPDQAFVMLFPVEASSALLGKLLCEFETSCIIDDAAVLERIRVFLDQVSALLECDAEIQQLREKAESLSLLHEIGGRLSNIRDEDQLLEEILGLIASYMGVDRCSLMIMNEARTHLMIKKAIGLKDVDTKAVKVPLGEGIAGHVAMGTRPLLIKDVAAEDHLISQVPEKDSFRTDSLLSVPLVAQGEVIGVINVNNRRDGLPFSEHDTELLVTIGSEIAAVLKRSYLALQVKKARELNGDIKRSVV